MVKCKEKKCWYDGSKLKGIIRELNLTQDDVAQYLGINKSTFNLKINGQVPFTQDEISLLLDFLKIPDSKIKDYFFEEKV